MHRLVGLLLLGASIPLLVWQAIPENQLTVSPLAFLALHSIMEIFAVVVAALVFFTGLGAPGAVRSLRGVVLGYAFLAVALLDILHFLSYLGMPDLVTPNTPHKAILFWLADRFFAAIGLLAYVLLPEARAIQESTRRMALAGVLVLMAGLAYVFLTMPEALPATFIPGEGLTPLKVTLEWLMFSFYIAIALLLYVRRHRVTHCDVERLGLALLLMAAGELFFTVYINVSSTANLLGHIYKVLAFYFLYLAIYSDAVSRPFRQMQHMLTHDALTGLPNRTAFGEQLDISIARARHDRTSCAVLLLDLDHLQDVNDTLGHEKGDMLLIGVAERLRSALPRSVYLARFSGDEFVALLEGLSPEEAKHIGERLLQFMTHEFDIGDDRLGISVSIGLVAYPGDGDSASVLMRHADLALHRAKLAGRAGLWVFSRDLAEGMQRRVLLEARLKHALAREELTVYYQPKQEIRTGRIVGWEALLRWNSTELGAISPAEFIPVAEQSGLILPIGAWVLREACLQVRAWQDEGLPVGTMAVNLSTRQFRQKDLAREVGVVLRDTGIAPADIELELTESAIMDNLASAAAVLAELKQLGVSIAVDDFGTGYSSLSYLKTFPIHCLKIDRSFIRDIPGDPNDTAIVRTIIALARNLGLTVVAEGVETEAQLAYLRLNHCDQAQGYLFSQPLPPDDCAELIRKGAHHAVA